MPLAPATPIGDPQKYIYPCEFNTQTIAADKTTDLLVVPKSGYLSAVRMVCPAAAAADPTNSRNWTIVDPTTRQVTDGIVGDVASKGKGQWVAGTVYAANDVVIDQNVMYVCISGLTSNTAPAGDTSHFTKINQTGFAFLTSKTANFTKDDVGKSISGTGFSSAVITAFYDSQTVGVTANSAVRNGLTVTIGASRTLAIYDLKTAPTNVSIAADVEADFWIGSTINVAATDTRVYKGDVLKLVSTHDGTGVVDPGGTVQLEILVYGDEGA